MSQMPPQYPENQPPHAPHMLQEAPGATGGLVMGILSIVLGFPIVGLILAIIGLQMSRSAKALVDANPHVYSNAGVAQAGFVCSIIGLILNLFSSLCGCAYFAFVILAIGGGLAGAGGP